MACESDLIALLLRDEGEAEDRALHRTMRNEDLSTFLRTIVDWISGSSAFSSGNQQIEVCESVVEKLKATSPPVFAVAFLDYVRSQSENVILAQAVTVSTTENENHVCFGLSKNSYGQGVSSTPAQTFPANRETIKPVLAEISVKDNWKDTYDDNFPVLGTISSSLDHKSSKMHIKPIRRVTPTPTKSLIVDRTFVFAKMEPYKAGQKVSRSMGMAPLNVDINDLMNKFGKKNRSKQKKSEPGIQSHNTELCLPRKFEGASPLPPIDTRLKQTLSADSSVLKLKRFGVIHAKLMKVKLVPSLLGELQYLFQLLSFCQPGKPCNLKGSEQKMLFKCSNDCALYACIVMEHLGKIIGSVGEYLLSALIQHPLVAQYSPALIVHMKGSLASHQAASLNSFKAYKVLNARNAQSIAETMPCMELYKREDAIGIPVSLPFQAARDSRHNYRSRELQKLYNNRELCRDYFYAIIRESVTAQNAFDFSIEDTLSKLKERMGNLMASLYIENYPWFADLFVEQLIQVAMYGETDPIVSGLAGQDPMKLQRLHGRLIECQRSRLTNAHTLQIIGKKTTSVDSKHGPRTTVGSITTVILKTGVDITEFFSKPWWIYVWVLEAADSYRLAVQMIWSLKSKICKLTELQDHSRDAAEIASILTQRVLSLKALASLLGFLTFYPGIGTTEACGPIEFSSPLHEFREWGVCRTEPPIDVVKFLEMAIASESMLLILPWVLDFLRLVKIDQLALTLPYFQRALMTLRRLYFLPLLDPESEVFGVSSMCILALLDRFFQFMDLPAHDSSSREVSGMSERGEGKTAMADCNSDLKITSCGLDRMVGVVDAYYIQHCCSTLMDLRMVIINSESKQPFSEKQINVKSIRKITPLQHSNIRQQGWLSSLEDTSISFDQYIQIKLQQTFLEQQPELQRLVDFIVDTVAVSASRAASLRSVPCVLQKALEELRLELTKECHSAELEVKIENIITAAIQEAVDSSVGYVTRYTALRTSEAIVALVGPYKHPSLIGVAAKIAADAAGSAACKKTLANISCDIRKCITHEVEIIRRSAQPSWKVERKDGNLQEQTAVVENTLATGSSAIKQQSIIAIVQEQGSKILLERILQCSSEVCQICLSEQLIDGKRHLLRIRLAAVCVAIEGMLSFYTAELPAGGFDAIVHSSSKGDHTHQGSMAFYDTETTFRIERGLVYRCIALMTHLCLLFPLEAFDYSSDVIEGCLCLLECVTMEQELVSIKNGADGEKCIPYDYARRTGCCNVGSNLGILMGALISLCEALIKCGIFKIELLVTEFLSPERWHQAFSKEPWKLPSFWFKAVTHGITNVLTRLISSERVPQKVEHIISISLEHLWQELSCKNVHVIGESGGPLGSEMVTAEKLTSCICWNLFQWRKLQAKGHLISCVE